MKLQSLLMIAAAAMTTSGALAAPGKARGKGPNAEQSAVENSYERRRYSRLGDYERNIVRDYYGNGDNCPPGLAKKNNGCMPPGIAKKNYQVGHPLHDDVDVLELPYGLESRLPILPDGYGYRLIDGDLGVIELATLVVLDALNFH